MDVHEKSSLVSTSSEDDIVRERDEACCQFWHSWSRKRRIIVFGCIVVLFLASLVSVIYLAVDLERGKNPPPEPEPPYGPPELGWRLPGNAIPTRYNIELSPDLVNFEFSGSCKVEFVRKRKRQQRLVIMLNVQEMVQESHYLLIHAAEMVIDSKSIFLDGTELTVKNFTMEKEYEVLIFEFEHALAVSKGYVGEFTFHAQLTDSMRGFYRSSYDDEGVKKYLATTHFEATDARRAFPCFDEPALKATFAVTLVLLNTTAWPTALSNMPVKSVTPRGPGSEAVTFEESKVMSTYLVAFVVSDFQNVTSVTSHGTQVSVWARPAAVQQGQFALMVAKGVLEHFDTYFEATYPLPKSDHIAIPDFNAGAMENWGLITYRETALLVDPVESSRTNEERVASVVAHELAHQWFGNLVTMEWWDQLWLNEGFATFVEYLGVDAVLPAWDLWGFFPVNDVQRALNVDSLASTHALHFMVEKPSEIDAMFNTITYSKGASILRMLQSFIGPENFRTGLASYLDAYQYGNAETVDLWNALDAASGENVPSLMHAWTEEPGYPLIYMEDKPQGGLLVRQKRFYTKEPMQVDAFNGLWSVPLGIRRKGEPTYTYVLMDQVASMSIAFDAEVDKWLIPNGDARGYFRVDYTPSLWNALSEELRTGNNLTEAERASLVDDAFELSQVRHWVQHELKTTRTQAGYHSPIMPLNLTRGFLQTETSYPVWFAANKGYSFMGKMLDVQHCYGDFEAYIQAMAGPPSDAMGWNVTGGTHAEASTRPMVANLAGYYGYPNALAEARALFASLQSGGFVVPDIRGAVYNTVVRHGTTTEFEWAWNAYEASDFPSERDRLLRAVANAPELWMIRLTLERALDENKVRPQDSVSLIERVALSSPQGRDAAWQVGWDSFLSKESLNKQFVRENWDVIVDRYGHGLFTLERLLTTILSGFSSTFRAEEIQSFFKDHPAPGGGDAGVKAALESIATNVQWLADNLEEVCNALPGLAVPLSGR